MTLSAQHTRSLGIYLPQPTVNCLPIFKWLYCGRLVTGDATTLGFNGAIAAAVHLINEVGKNGLEFGVNLQLVIGKVHQLRRP